MARLTPRFSASRTVCEYTDHFYLAAAARYRQRAADQGGLGQHIVEWRQALEQHWASLRFGEAKVETDGGQHRFEAWVYLGDLDPQAVRVELFADGLEGHAPERVAMEPARQLEGSANGFAYRAAVPDLRSANDYTARVIPQHEGVAVPLEAAQILWQR
jgi:starch phosphorylase